MIRTIAPNNVTRQQLSMRLNRKLMMRKKYAGQVISIELIQTKKHHLQVLYNKEKAIFTSQQSASQIFSTSMFIN